MNRIFVWLLAAAFNIRVMHHFWGLKPVTDNELICDGLGVLLVLVAFIYSDLKKEA